MDDKVLAIVPVFRGRNQIIEIVAGALKVVDHVLVVDDSCPEDSGLAVEQEFSDNPRVTVVFHDENLGVGGAMKTGFRWALQCSFEIIVKLDADGQMKPYLIPELVSPLKHKEADFAKGNRFDSPRHVRSMPIIRIIGNGALSLLTKISTGYWSVSDPTNGYLAIRKEALSKLEFQFLSDGYFFESDLLFRLAIVRARICEMPMSAVYGDEKSGLRIWRVLITFPFLHLRNLMKRLAYSYYVRDWSIGSVELPIGLALMSWGTWFGLSTFASARDVGETVSAGQAVTTAIAIILGFQLFLSFISQDIQREPKSARF